MAFQPTQKSEEQRLSLQLQRDKANLETKKGSRGVALDISTDPKQSSARRAEFAAKYKKLLEEISDLETKIEATTRQIDRSKTAKTETEAKSKTDVIKEEFDLLADAYAQNEEPEIKARMDKLAEDYRTVYAKDLGTPISRAAAYTMLSGGAKPVDRTARGGQIETPAQDRQQLQAITPTPTPTETPGTPPKSKVTSGTGLEVQAGPGYKPDKPTGKLEVQAGPGYKPGAKGGKDTGTVEQPGGPVVKSYDALLAEVQADYSLPDIIFNNVKSLGKILDKYVNQKINIDQFRKEIEKDPWYRQNSAEIKARYLQKFNFQDLVNSGNAKGTTDYEQQIAKITNNLIRKSREIGSAIDEGQAKLIAEDLYIHNQDADDAVVTRRLVSGIRPMAGMVGGRLTEDYSGLALQNYQGLQAIAKRNGFRLEDILPRGVDGKPATAQETLQRLALGEIDPTRLEQDVRKLAAIGQPQFVRDLLGQGIDLEEVYSPYRKTMARILELDEGQIDLTDPTLRMGINDKGDVNLYDYSKALRQDSRWQYTGNAREEVSDAALTVLRNFGFQG
jgi:hypothetical protein